MRIFFGLALAALAVPASLLAQSTANFDQLLEKASENDHSGDDAMDAALIEIDSCLYYFRASNYFLRAYDAYAAALEIAPDAESREWVISMGNNAADKNKMAVEAFTGGNCDIEKYRGTF